VGGIATTADLHRRILRNAFFRRGEVTTGFIRRHMLGE
jgi:acetyl-CoA carboxylase biotin carboxylase subunit